jgi:sphinganine-1-phosphate aldolase
MGSDAIYGLRVRVPHTVLQSSYSSSLSHSGYLESCRSIVSCTKKIISAIKTDIPELYVLGNPPASCVAFGARSPKVNVLEVGDAMSKRGWHLNGLMDPAAVHIACTRLTVPLVDTFIADLKDSVREAKANPSGKGHMVSVYGAFSPCFSRVILIIVLVGLGNSSPVGHSMVGELAGAFLDTLYKA